MDGGSRDKSEWSRRVRGLSGEAAVGKPGAAKDAAGYPVIHRAYISFIQVLFLLLC
jgi:hypothetical protein